MPMITLQIAGEPDSALARDVAANVSSLTTRILRKDANVTSVAVDFVPKTLWFIAGKSAAEHGKTAFFLDVRVSDGTNTKNEKDAFVAAAFEALERLLGPVHEESYVHVDDARADAYGYGGKTMERRRYL